MSSRARCALATGPRAEVLGIVLEGRGDLRQAHAPGSQCLPNQNIAVRVITGEGERQLHALRAMRHCNRNFDLGWVTCAVLHSGNLSIGTLAMLHLKSKGRSYPLYKSPQWLFYIPILLSVMLSRRSITSRDKEEESLIK
jgi:hypothetical protein